MTSAGAINITTRKASFTPGIVRAALAATAGGFQTKLVTGPYKSGFVRYCLSFSGTQRDGLLKIL